MVQIRFALIKWVPYARGMELALFFTFVAVLGALATAFGADTRTDGDNRWPGADHMERR